MMMPSRPWRSPLAVFGRILKRWQFWRDHLCVMCWRWTGRGKSKCARCRREFGLLISISELMEEVHELMEEPQ